MLGQKSGAILTALAASKGDRLGTEVDVLEPEGDAFGDSQVCPIHELGHELRCAGHRSQHVAHFLLGQHRRDAVAPPDTPQPRHVAEWLIQHIAIEEDQRVKCLGLS